MGAEYIVMIVMLIIWAGIFLYIFSLDNRVRKLEKENER